MSKHLPDLRILNAIEALADVVVHGSMEDKKRSRTDRGLPYVVFSNGMQRPGGQIGRPACQDLDGLVEDTIATITAYVETVPRPRRIVWRVVPEVVKDKPSGAYTTYARLAVEPLLPQDAEPVTYRVEDIDAAGRVLTSQAREIVETNTLRRPPYVDVEAYKEAYKEAYGEPVQILEPPESYTPPQEGGQVLVKCDCSSGRACPQGKTGSAACFVWMDVGSVAPSKLAPIYR